jgi:hypothetical protein
VPAALRLAEDHDAAHAKRTGRSDCRGRDLVWMQQGNCDNLT